MKTRTQQLQIRVTPAQKAAIRDAAQRAGMDMSSWIMDRVLPSRQLELRELIQILSQKSSPMTAHAAWSEVIDLLQDLQPSEFEKTLRDLSITPHLRGISANYFTALVEMAADKKQVEPPKWTRAIAPLPAPFFGTENQALRLYLLRASPAVFRRRNIFVDAGVGDRV